MDFNLQHEESPVETTSFAVLRSKQTAERNHVCTNVQKVCYMQQNLFMSDNGTVPTNTRQTQHITHTPCVVMLGAGIVRGVLCLVVQSSHGDCDEHVRFVA